MSIDKQKNRLSVRDNPIVTIRDRHWRDAVGKGHKMSRTVLGYQDMHEKTFKMTQQPVSTMCFTIPSWTLRKGVLTKTTTDFSHLNMNYYIQFYFGPFANS